MTDIHYQITPLLANTPATPFTIRAVPSNSTIDTLVEALRILARDIESGDGVANAAIAEAADMLDSLKKAIAYKNSQIELLKKRLDELTSDLTDARIKEYAVNHESEPDFWHDADKKFSGECPTEAVDPDKVFVGEVIKVYSAKNLGISYITQIPLDYYEDGSLRISVTEAYPTLEEALRAAAPYVKTEGTAV